MPLHPPSKWGSTTWTAAPAEPASRRACPTLYVVPQPATRRTSAESRSALRTHGLEAELRVLRRHRRRIPARQAGAAELRRGALRRLDESVVRQIRERR